MSSLEVRGSRALAEEIFRSVHQNACSPKVLGTPCVFMSHVLAYAGFLGIILRGELLHHDWKFRPTFYDGVFLLAGWEVKFSGPITRNARTRLGEESGKGRKMGTQFRGTTRGG